MSKDSDGGIHVGYVDAGDTVIYESDKTPELQTHHWYQNNGWLFPWNIASTDTYTLVVPKGSVVQDISVAP